MSGIFTYIYYKDQPNVGIHMPYMNPLGKALPPQMCWENAISNTVAHGMNETMSSMRMLFTTDRLNLHVSECGFLFFSLLVLQ